MRIVSSIVEYNPFHNGHKYHLEESIRSTNASHSIALMSSSFVQRGEPALVDKWTRAKMAINNGVDLVLELPFIYSCQSAELFAFGALSILDAIKVVDYLSFGSELGSLNVLEEIVDLLLKEPASYRKALKGYLDQGYSFPQSRSKALVEELENPQSDDSYEDILKGSNNILAIEYLKSLKKLNSDIKPVTIERLGPRYNDFQAINNIASATGIRDIIINKGLKNIKEYVPQNTFILLEEFFHKYGHFNSLNNFEEIINFLLLTKDKEEIKAIIDVVEGLENRLVDKSYESKKIDDLIGSVASKRYPLTRIQRILIHLMNNLKEDRIKALYDYKPQYIRVLGANTKGLEILSQIKKESDIIILTKYANYHHFNNIIMNSFLYYEEKATDIYFWGLDLKNKKIKLDYYTSPYIKK